MNERLHTTRLRLWLWLVHVSKGQKSKRLMHQWKSLCQDEMLLPGNAVCLWWTEVDLLSQVTS